jgi:hypothetical protein
VKDALGEAFGVMGGPMGSPLANLATWGRQRRGGLGGGGEARQMSDWQAEICRTQQSPRS